MRCLALTAAAVLATTGCGYHVAGKATLMPDTVHTIAITAFTNRTIRYKLAQHLPADIAHEFIERTHYRVVTDPNAADAVLSGTLLLFQSYPIIADQTSGRATVVQASAFLSLTLTERTTGKVLLNRPNFEARERYEISVNATSYFDESGAGMERLSKDVARSVVTAVVENF